MTESPDGPINVDKDENKEQPDYYCPECDSFIIATWDEICDTHNIRVYLCRYDEELDEYIEVEERDNSYDY